MHSKWCLVEFKGAPGAGSPRVLTSNKPISAQREKAPGIPLDKIKMAPNDTMSMSSLTLVSPSRVPSEN